MKRLTVTLPDDIYDGLSALATELESTKGAQLRRGARLLLADGEPEADGFDPREWKFEVAHITPPVPTNIYRPASGNGPRAYLLVSEGVALWVLPDDHTSGQLRSRTIRDALASCEGVEGIDPLAYVAGRLWLVGVRNMHYEEER